MKLPAVLTTVNLQRKECQSVSIQRWASLEVNNEQFVSYFVILANDYIVSVEEVWDVLLDHIIPWIQRILLDRNCVQTVKTHSKEHVGGEKKHDRYISW